MNKARRLAAGITLIVASITASADDAYVNGLWFDGEGFVAKTVYVVQGRLTSDRPGRVDNTYDLAGGYVIPPFGEAHNHDLASGHEIDQRIREYLADGVFYAKMQSAFSIGFESLASNFNKPDSVDVIFAFAPITGPGGHPMRIRELFFDRGYYEGVFESKDEIAGIGYTEVGTREELMQKWPGLIDQGPDFVKFMLNHSEEYALRKDDPEFFGFKGIDPDLVPDLVELSHAAGLTITAHVDTAADFHYAVAAGVDEIAHLPGNDELEVIRSKDAELAAAKDVVVVTTVSLSGKVRDDYPKFYEELMAQHARNLQRLKEAGVRIVVGSDMPFRDTSVGEAAILHGLGVFSNRELLKMWCETTPRAIFPDREIGRLSEGYEASFLVLEGNPIDDFDQIRGIRMRVKQGQRLELPD